MASQQQSPPSGVARHSHRPERVRAAPPPGDLAPSLEAAPVASPDLAPPRKARYALLVVGAYAAAPTLAFATWRWLATALPGSLAAAAAVGLLVLLPSLAHLAGGGRRRAGLVLASLLGYLAVGGAGGAALGRSLARATCAPQIEGECGLTVLAWLVVGAASGAAIGYSVHAARQVLRTIDVRSRSLDAASR